ncbi:MAG: cysteine desulfurase [Flavobacteriales bacterium]|nr:cysteine desulfurase [Flavobacteriales bacterium]
MNKIYLDNAATTKLHPEVLDEMYKVMKDYYGNPSSVHFFGRKSKSLIESSRKTISSLLNVSPGEIFFTSGGTEADNACIVSCIKDFSITHAVTTKLEHHAVLHTLQNLEKIGIISLSYVDFNSDGEINVDDLNSILSDNPRSFVSIMHANNEIGTKISLKEIGDVCKNHNSIFHSDTVQTMAHYDFNLSETPVHFVTGSAHKFHGPKGVGFLYIDGEISINPFIFGGAQERNMRAGTENLYGIVGMSKAMEIAYRDLKKDKEFITSLKNHMIIQLKNNINGVCFNGIVDEDKSLYTILNVSLPPTELADMLIYNLDLLGVSCSSGSACSSGSNTGSHVLQAIGCSNERAALRFSFSKYNNKKEIDLVVKELSKLFI